MSKRKPKAIPYADPANPETWPVIWRVVAPGAGSYCHDMVFIETLDEAEAHRCLNGHRRQGFPARLEKVHCGPLPSDAREQIEKLRAGSPQNPGSTLGPIPGAWEVRS